MSFSWRAFGFILTGSLRWNIWQKLSSKACYSYENCTFVSAFVATLATCAMHRRCVYGWYPAFRLERSAGRSEEHTSELQSLMRISSAVFCLKKNNLHNNNN